MLNTKLQDGCSHNLTLLSGPTCRTTNLSMDLRSRFLSSTLVHHRPPPWDRLRIHQCDDHQHRDWDPRWSSKPLMDRAASFLCASRGVTIGEAFGIGVVVGGYEEVYC